MLLIIYQIFSSLLSHLPFSVQFFLHFYGVTFFGTPNIFACFLTFLLASFFFHLVARYRIWDLGICFRGNVFDDANGGRLCRPFLPKASRLGLHGRGRVSPRSRALTLFIVRLSPLTQAN